MNLAPIVLFCYNRPHLLQHTLDSLLANPLSKQSDLYVFVDGPKANDTAENVKNIQEVRKIINELNGFNSIYKQFRENNLGLVENVKQGIQFIFEKFDKVIVLEDDLLFSRDFLEFMNNGLDYYQANLSIGSISGYSFGYEKINCDTTLFFTNRHSSWGWGTWKNRWENIDWEISDHKQFFMDKIRINKFENAGKDFIPMLKKSLLGLNNSWAIRWNYHNYKLNRYCVVPKFSKINNSGTMGGTNFKIPTNKYQTNTHEKDYIFTNDIKFVDEVAKFNRNNFKPSLIRKLIHFFCLR